MSETLKIRVEVTWEDIDQGVAENPSLCPIACALRRLGVTAPVVVEDSVCGIFDGRRFYVGAPDSVSRFVANVDGFAPDEDKEELTPFVFDLDTELLPSEKA